MKNKLSLSEIKVKSFVTDLEKSEARRLHGGAVTTDCLTGIYPTLPVDYCIEHGSNGHNCPTEGGALCGLN